MTDTLASLQIELTAATSGLEASLSSVQNHLAKVSTNAVEAGNSTHNAGTHGSEGILLLEAAAEKLEFRLAGLGEEAGLVGIALADLGGNYLIAGAALGAVAIGVEKSIEAFSEAQTASVRLSAVLAASGVASGQSAEQIEDYAERVSRSTTYTKEQVEGAASVLLQFQSITGDAFTRVLNIAENLSAATGHDLTSSLHAVAMAAQDPISGLEQLRRSGAGLTEQQLQYIAAVAQANGVQAAQNVLLDDLEAKTNGTAAALGNTMAGAVDHVSTAFKNLAEQIGSVLNFQGKLQTLADWLNEAANGVKVLEKSEQLATQSPTAVDAADRAGAAVSKIPLIGPALAGTGLFQGVVGMTASASNIGNARQQIIDDNASSAIIDEMAKGIPTAPAAATTGSQTAVPSDASSVGEKAISTITQEIALQKESAAARAGDLAVMKAQDEASSKHQTLSSAEIATIRSKATALEIATSAQKADTAEAKKAQEQSDSLTTSLNEALIAAQKSVSDVGLDAVQKAGADANVEIQKELAARPLLHGQMLQQQQDTANQIVQTKEQAAAAGDLYSLYQATLTPIEQYDETMKRIADDRPFAKTSQDFEAIQRAVDNANDSINKMKPIFDETAQGISTDFQNMLETLMSSSTNKFKTIADTFLTTFENMIAQMGVMALASPVIVPIIESLGGSLGVSQTGIASELTKLGLSTNGTSGISGLSGLSSIASLAGTSLLPKGLSSSLDSFGNSALGIGGKDLGIADSFGNADPAGSVGLGGQVSGLTSVGNIGGAFAGNYLGSAVFGDSGTKGEVLGGVGAAGGAALATSAALAGTIGTALGAWAGPIGAAVGAFAGQGIASLFGGKVSVKGEATDLSLGTNSVMDTTGATSGDKYSAANRSVSDGITAFAQQVNAMLTSIAGASIANNLSVSTAADQTFFTIWGNAKTAITSTGQGLHDLTDQLADLYAASGTSTADIGNLKTAIGHIDFSDATTALSNIQFALNLDHLGDTKTSLDAVDTEMTNLNTTFHQYQLTAAALGLSVDTVNTAFTKTLATMQTADFSPIQSSLLDKLLPGYSSVSSENASYATQMHDAAVLGLSAQQISEITLNHNLEIQSLLQSNNAVYKQQISDATTLVSTYGNLSTSWATLIQSLTTGSDSTLSSTAQLDALRSQVQTVGAQAQTGDTDAQSQLLTLIPQFISASQSVNGYNASYAADQQLALNYASAAKSVADQQLTVQQSILNAANAQTGLLTTMASAGTSGNANDKLVAAIKAGYTGLTNDQINAIFDSAGLTVAPGNGARTNALNTPADTGINASLNSVFHDLGVPGFANGGLIGAGGGGQPGVDSVPLIGMPDEFIMRAKAVSAIGAPTLNYMNATGRLPSNDNGQSLASLRADVQRLTDVVYAGFNDNGEKLAGIRSATAASAQMAEASGWK